MNYCIGDFPPVELGFYQQGWVCPKCGKVYAPSVCQCFTCGNEQIYTTTTTGDCPMTSGTVIGKTKKKKI